MKYITAFILIILIIGAVTGRMSGAEKPLAIATTIATPATIAGDVRAITGEMKEARQGFQRIRDGLDDLYYGLAIEWNQGAINREYKDIDFANQKIRYIEEDLSKTEERRVYHRNLHNEEPKSRQQEYDDIEKLKAEIETHKQSIIELKAEGKRIRANPTLTRPETMDDLDAELAETDNILNTTYEKTEESIIKIEAANIKRLQLWNEDNK